MSENIREILDLESELNNDIQDSYWLTEEEFSDKLDKSNIVGRVLNILKKMDILEILEVIRRCQNIPHFIDMKLFIKKYPLNKDKLEENQDLYMEEFENLTKTCDNLMNISVDYLDYEKYLDLLDMDNTFNYLLKKMSNEQLYSLSLKTGSWEEKLYYFSFFKK